MNLLFSFLPIVLFFVVYQWKGIYVATAVLMAAFVLLNVVFWLKNRRFERMHLITLGVALVFGGMTLLLHNPVFIKWKPTILDFLFALAFALGPVLGRKPILRSMLEKTLTLPDPVWSRLNAAWIAFFAFSGVLNLLVAYTFSEAAWVNFKLFGQLGLTLVFMVAQGFWLWPYMEAEPAKEVSESAP